MQKRRILAPCALLASLGIALAGCAASNTPRAVPAGANASTSAAPGTPDLLKMITDLAANNGDGSLTNVQYVSTNAGQAASVVYGDPSVAESSNANVSVFVVAASGSFTANSAKQPSGSTPPTGTVITEIVQADTGSITDWGVSDNYPDLAKLGSVVPLG